MRNVRAFRAGLLACVATGAVLATGACTAPALDNGPGYVICDDTSNTAACPSDTSPVAVNSAQ